MNARRLPLADVPNAANSPLRTVAAANALHGKRPRTHTKDERDLIHAQPPTKRQFVQTDDAQARRDAVLRRSGPSKETPLQKKLQAARGRPQSVRLPADETEEERRIKQLTEKHNIEHVREWQKHYKRTFPQYTLYFDSVPDDVRPLITQDIHTLGGVRFNLYPPLTYSDC